MAFVFPMSEEENLREDEEVRRYLRERREKEKKEAEERVAARIAHEVHKVSLVVELARCGMVM